MALFCVLQDKGHCCWCEMYCVCVRVSVHVKDTFSALFLCMLRTFMNTGKQQKPVLTGQRFKTRKRGESIYIFLIQITYFKLCLWFKVAIC